MSRPPRHSIGRVLLDVEQTPEQAPGLESALRYWQRERLPLLLDEWLSEWALTGYTLRLDRIEVAIGNLDFRNIEAEWAAKIEPRLREAIVRALREAAPQAVPSEAAAAEQLYDFLQSGHLSSFADTAQREAIPELIRKVLASAAPLPPALLQLLTRDAAAQTRLIRHADDSMLAAWVEKAADTKLGQAALQAWKRLASRGAQASGLLFWREVLALIGLYTEASERMEAIRALETRLSVAESRRSEPPEAQQAARDKTKEPEGIQSPPNAAEAADEVASNTESWSIPNAGIALIAPWLPRLWAQLGWTKDHQFSSLETTWLAVQMVQYLSDGQEAPPPEYQLLLPKILCGLPPAALFDPERGLSDAERAEGDVLLEAVLKQAPGLGLISIGALRGSFLWRAGLLRPADFCWQLHVAQETHDILLERIPWNFQIIRYLWMEAPIYVEWNTGY